MMFEVKTKPLGLRSLYASVLVGVVAAASGCAGLQTKATGTPEEAMEELSKSLRLSAQKVAQARVELATLQPVGTDGRMASGAASPMRDATSRIDIDYAGPVENALRIVASSIGWDFQVAGKKRAESLVSLRHQNTDAIVVLRDIGAQCGSRCDVHASVREGGRSSISLTYRD